MPYRPVVRPVLTLLPLLAALWSAGPAGAAAWSSSPLSVDEGSGVTTPHVATDRTGTVVAVWERNGAIRSAVKVPGGSLSPAQTIGTGTADKPALALDGHGNALVAYESKGGIHAVQRLAGGAWTDLGPVAAKGTLPSVGFSGDGAAVVAWAEATELRASVRQPNGVFPLGSLVGTGGDPVDEVRVVTNPASPDVVLVWASSSGPALRVRSSRGQANGLFDSPQPVEAVTYGNGVTGARVASLDAAMSPAGAVEAAWTDFSVDGALNRSIALKATSRLPGAAAGWNPVRQLDVASFGLSGGNEIREAHVAPLDGGGAVVAWQYGEVVGGYSQAWSASRAPGATTYSSPATVGTSGDLTTWIHDVDVRPLPGNGALALWSRGNEDVRAALSQGTAPFGAQSLVPIGSIPSVREVELADDGIGDAAALVLRQETLVVARYDGTGPELRDLVSPGSAMPGEPANFSAVAFDALTSASAASWDFGDGTTATGASVAHTYTVAGTYKVTVSSTDAAGNHSSRTSSIAVAPRPLAGGKPPRITRFSITPRAFGIAPRATPAVARKRGASFLYTVSAPARVTISLRRCRPTPHGRAARGKRCTRLLAAGSLSRAARTGVNRLRFSGRIGRRALRAGSYRATIVARDAAGRRSAPRSLAFRVR
jgi:PKD domain